jgi:hypothetical protein
MAKIKSRSIFDSEPVDDGFEDLLEEIRGFSREMQEDNDRAEERDNERSRQRISIWEV